MNQIPLFSIIVPVYKVENCLDKCVKSLINQTYADIEIILVDDGSPDKCPEMCDAYAVQDSRIKVIHKTNGGLSNARNTGIKTARGVYLLFVDSDDYIECDTCEKLLPFTQSTSDIIIGDGVSEGASKRLRHGSVAPGMVCSGKSYLKTACRNRLMPMAAWLYVYRRKFLQDNALCFRESILHEDEQFTPRAFLKAERVVESGVQFYHYIIREGSITTQKDLRRNARDLYATCLQLREIYEHLDDIELKTLLIDSLVSKYLSLYQQGKLYQYGRAYVHKDFVWKNAHCAKTKCKAILFCIAPKLYWHINHLSKLRK